MRVCQLNPATGQSVNNCGSATCPLCLKRKRNTRNRKLVTAFAGLEKQGHQLLAVTIEPLGLPTSNRAELTGRIRKWTSIRRAITRKLKPRSYYFQAEFKSDRDFGDPSLLAPHCHGIVAVPSHTRNTSEVEYLEIKDHKIHIQPIYALSGWVEYTLKDIVHPKPLANSRIKLFA